MMADEDQVLQRIEGHLDDIVTTLGAIDRALAMAAEVFRFWVAAETGLDPLKDTDFEEDAEPLDPPPWSNRGD